MRALPRRPPPQSLFRNFDELVRRQLAPIWHTVSPKTRQIVADLRTLRRWGRQARACGTGAMRNCLLARQLLAGRRTLHGLGKPMGAFLKRCAMRCGPGASSCSSIGLSFWMKCTA